MELSNQFTKEQLIERINETLSCYRHFITPDDEWQTIKKTIAIYEIALAALTAAPIGAFHISDQQVGATTDYLKDGEWPIDNGVIEVYAVQPAPVVPEKLPCSVELRPGLIIGKGCKTETLLTALKRRADFYAELDAMTPEEKEEYAKNIEAFKEMLPQPAPAVPEERPSLNNGIIGFDEGWNACRAAMLKGGAK
ncbi:protein Eaa [Citrobacter amalonaticus]|uniref:protein Eaa n=1 Tax=Citrobacter amalonaticus TaxID=35703 RepID=UPI0021E3D861|nr:protein Eaa [Citrobacter amalonaticus]UYF56265.1 protein Eaa [Citrobacter amalonaticus]